MTWTCPKCGATFEAFEPAQRHSNDTGHARLAASIERRKPAR